MGANQSSPKATADDPASPKTGWYQRYTDKRIGRDKQISEDDLKKYTGRDRAEFDKFAATATGVGADQLAGHAGADAGIGEGSTGLAMIGNKRRDGKK